MILHGCSVKSQPNAPYNDELDNIKERDDEAVLHGWNKQETAPQQSPIIRALVSVYADHPDYRTDW